MWWILRIVALMAALVACAPQKGPELFVDLPLPQPELMLLPAVDSSDSALPWYLEREFTQGLCERLNRHALCGKVQLFAREGEGYQKAIANLFSDQFAAASESFQASILVAVEILEHAVVAVSSDPLPASFPAQGHRSLSRLQIKARLRVIEQLEGPARLLCDELLTSQTLLPEDSAKIDYSIHRWGVASFANTPFAKAHGCFIEEMTSCIEKLLENQSDF